MKKTRKKNPTRDKKRREKHNKRRNHARVRRSEQEQRRRANQEGADDYENPLASWDPEEDGVLRGAMLARMPPVVFGSLVGQLGEATALVNPAALAELDTLTLLTQLTELNLDVTQDGLVAQFGRVFDVHAGIDDILCHGDLYALPARQRDFIYFAALTLISRLVPDVPRLEDLDLALHKAVRSLRGETPSSAELIQASREIARICAFYGSTSEEVRLAIQGEEDDSELDLSDRFFYGDVLCGAYIDGVDLDAIKPLATEYLELAFACAKAFGSVRTVRSSGNAMELLAHMHRAGHVDARSYVDTLRSTSERPGLVAVLDVLCFGIDESTSLDVVPELTARISTDDEVSRAWLKALSLALTNLPFEISGRIDEHFYDAVLSRIEEEPNPEDSAVIETTAT